MVNALKLEPVPPLGPRGQETVKELQVRSDLGGGFETNTYSVLLRRGWMPVYGIVNGGCVEGIEVEIVDRDTGPGVPWRRWLRVTAPVGTLFRKVIRTPNREAARVDREELPYDITPINLIMTRHGIVHAQVVAEEARRPRPRAEPQATPADVQRSVAKILEGLARR